MTIKKIKRYFGMWLLFAKNSVLVWAIKKEAIYIFLFGKFVRYIFYFGFLYFLVSKTKGLVGYSINETLFFTATYILIDTLGQLFFRSVYTFRQLVVTGDFDLILTKPVNPLFRSLFGRPDPVDFITIPPILCVVIYFGFLLNPSLLNILYYLLLVLNGLVIVAAFHIIVLSIGVITLEVDNTIMVFRDLSSMGRLPIEIYREPMKSILTFLIPIGIIFSTPVKSMVGLISPIGIISSMIFGFCLLLLSIKFWAFALRKYTSASS